MNKKEIRKAVRERRENLDQEYIDKASIKIFENLKSEEIFLNAKRIFSYMDFKNEVRTDLINKYIQENGENLILPRVIDEENMIAVENKTEFSRSSFGNIEPVGEEYEGEIDLVIVPGVAFDKKGNRIGFGRGYYDRFPKKYKGVRKIALAFEVQIVDEIEADAFDEKIEILITENKIYRF